MIAKLRVLILILLVAHVSAADDVVVYKSGTDEKKESNARGQILDFTGKSVTILLIGNREQLIPTERVVKYESSWTDEQTAADKLFAEAKFAEAHDQYNDAVSAERRVWVKRLILSKQVWCLRALGKSDVAAEKFLLIVGNDPTTQFFDCIPLAWQNERPDASFERQVQTWLRGRDGPVAQLIGASWSMPSQAAKDVLLQLGNNENPRIAHLADAQRWRSESITAKESDVARWQKQVDRMPKSLRAGPNFVIAKTLSQLGQHEPAAMTFMRTAIFHPHDRQLVASSLFMAGKALEELGRTNESVGLYREVASGYADVAVAAEATGRLESLTKGAEKSK